MAEKERSTGYLETAFRERQTLAEQQRTEITKEAGLLGRIMKDKGRKDFAQKKEVQRAQVKHVSRIGAGAPRKSHTMGTTTQRGSAKGRGQATKGVRSGAKKTEGQKRAAAASSPSSRSAGGVAQLKSGVRWTAAGGQEAGPERDVSRFQVAHKIIDPLNPHRVLGTARESAFQQQRLNRFSPGGSGQQATKGGVTADRAGAFKIERGGRLALKAKQMHQAQQVKTAKVAEYRRRIAPQYGPAAADAVMFEWSRRQEAMYGEAGTGGLLTPGMLFGNMEKPK